MSAYEDPEAWVRTVAFRIAVRGSWLVTQRRSGVDGLPLVDHNYLVQVGNRVALLRVTEFGDGFRSTAGDATLLAELQQALEK